MSGYFARLAQRTGLTAGTGVPTQTLAPTADLVEGDAQVEARPEPGVTAAAGWQSGASEAVPSAPPVRIADVAVAPERPLQQDAPRAEPAAFDAALEIEEPTVMKPLLMAQTPSARFPRQDRAASPSVLSPSAPSSSGEEMTEPFGVERTAAPLQVETEGGRVKMISAPSGAEMPRQESRFIETRPAGEVSTSRSPRVAGRFDEFGTPGERVEPLGVPAIAPSPHAGPRSTQRATDEVAVHIGAIQVEIYPLAAPPAAGSAQAQREVAGERSRFEPRRHYLRF
jgi:hypothetical protein